MKRYNEHGHRVWAEVDLDDIVFNYRQAAARADNRPVCCVIKANAYGHGAVPVARALAGAGAECFAVFTPEEALQICECGGDVLMMGVMCPAAATAMADTLAQNGVILTVGDLRTAETYAKALKRRARICIELDTGMIRTGLPVGGMERVNRAVDGIMAIAAMPKFEVEGVITHFSAPEDSAEKDFTDRQESLFNEVCRELENRGLNVKRRHCSSSAAVLTRVDAIANMVRPGIMLCGYGAGIELRPAMSLRARIIQVRRIKKGVSVGYGRSWRAPRDSVIATVSAGYADGLHRVMSGKIHMLVRGLKAAQVGRVCMDMCMLDVTDIAGAEAGDTATIIGADGEFRITADDLAEAAHTIPYEILCAVGPRVPRLYIKDGVLTDTIAGYNTYL